ncbi:hypothetical protein MJ904_19510 [Massilia sp. MB5]|uniref:hypothetical protein n=1 Tax=Massilia sp. MB5 TaxID=2919578 RepID=UPI001F0FF409|nr:hypothetical protein [Massilia sp. MB5]UMR29256.1 hypothetical protein MJ904_19510 [Massilia sp. MB5]
MKVLLSLLFLLISLVPHATVRAGELIITLQGGIKIQAIEKAFVPKQHQLKGCSEKNQNCEIDGAVVVAPMGMPQTQLLRLAVQIGKKKYDLDTTGMFDPRIAENGFAAQFGGFCYDPNNCAFRGVFGEAGGLYAAQWVIRNGKAWRTVLTDDMDTAQFFRANLTPPQYN